MNNGALVWPSIPRHYANYFNWTDPCIVRENFSSAAAKRRQHFRVRHLSMLSRFFMLMIAFVIIYYAFDKKGF